MHLPRDRTRYRQRLEKLLEDALCKLSSAVSKMAGSVPVRAMIEAVIAGERDPRVPAGLALGPVRAKRAGLERVFTGFGPQHAFAAAAHLRAIDFLDEEIRAGGERVRARVAAIPAAWGAGADGTTGPQAGLGGDAAVLPAGARLTEVPGISELIAIGLIAETGLDMTRFPTAGHLVPRAGTAPVAGQSGPRKGRGKKGRAAPVPAGWSPGRGPARRTRTRSWVSGTAGSGSGPAAAGGRKPAARSAGRSWSSSGTC